MKWPWATRKELEAVRRKIDWYTGRLEALETRPVLEPGEFKTRTLMSSGHVDDHNQIAAWINDHQENHAPRKDTLK